MGVLLKRRVMHTVLYVISIVIALITGFPFLFLVINSFKGMGEYLTNIWMLPKEPYLGNYQMILKPDFLRYFLNSVIVSAISVFIIVVVSSMISFTFARMRYRGEKSAVLCYYRRNDDSCTYDPDSYVYPVKQYRADRFPGRSGGTLCQL